VEANVVLAERSGVFRTHPTAQQLRLEHASWNPGIDHYDAPDGDDFWERVDGSRSAWGFSWIVDSADVEPTFAGRAKVEIHVLVEDGSPDGEVLASALSILDLDSGRRFSGGRGFFSRAQLGEMNAEQQARSPAAEPIHFGWYNDLAGQGAWLEAYPAGGGYWCVRGRDSVGGGRPDWCAPEDYPGRGMVTVSLSTTFSAAGVMGDVTLFVDAAPGIVSVRALPGDGRELEFKTYAPPPEASINRRFAWITIGEMAGSYTLIGYDALGNQVARAGSDAPGPPPPPPPPSR
jgi:hypothetical protein